MGRRYTVSCGTSGAFGHRQKQQLAPVCPPVCSRVALYADIISGGRRRTAHIYCRQSGLNDRVVGVDTLTLWRKISHTVSNSGPLDVSVGEHTTVHRHIFKLHQSSYIHHFRKNIISIKLNSYIRHKNPAHVGNRR